MYVVKKQNYKINHAELSMSIDLQPNKHWHCVLAVHCEPLSPPASYMYVMLVIVNVDDFGSD